MGRLKFVLGIAFLSAPLFAQGVDLNAIEASLSGGGLRGWIHGSAADLGHYVFTYRDPQDFFIHQEFSLIPDSAAVENDLKKLKRHDAVTLFGKFAPVTSEQPHIQVSKVQLDTPFTSVPDYQRSVQIPQDLAGKTSLLATVHAVAGGGEVLVVEYRDAVLPIFVKDKAHAAALYRGDKIRVHFKIQKHPSRPTHLVLDPKSANPIELMSAIQDQDGKLLDLEGSLVYFPQSPQLRFGVYALQVQDADGLKLNYTLVNFEDPQVFSDIRAKLEAIWQAGIATAENGRNCLINRQIKIRAVGKGNVVSPNQANPQILLEGPDAVSHVP